ncbi:SGNH/GDSL hydrolase family protein [Paenibacillus sp. N3.4]|uniref:SGNH/GDSL hydrolase family protein n=1 Tax=Paenibacillus sp. N3.4 TaxID=2603222 RepID=UPI0011CB797E|nr:SGNH/GDSL hydrolase family protein [Paenibacillus sp. N3.4]TXK85773.1 hypothetical protein FU659_02385 [Paenibacillus sp. N3.4]
MKISKIKGYFFIAFFIVVISFLFMKNYESKISYLALGDSIPAGVSPYSTVSSLKYEKSYPDFISEHLGKSKDIEYTKKYAVPGSTTLDLLSDIHNDVIKDNESIRNRLKHANLITVGIGANDLLKSYALKETNSQTVIKTIGLNLSEIIDEIKRMNPSIKIYIVGYYNLFPLKMDVVSEKFNQDYVELNKQLEEVSLRKDAKFVGTNEVFKDHYGDFLPVIGNVHPNEFCQEKISEKILEVVNE